MLSLQIQNSPQIYYACPIEFHTNNTRPSGRSQSEDSFIIFAPDKMLSPLMFSWIVEGYFLLANGIKRKGLGILKIITALTGKGPIMRLMCSSFALRQNVFYGKTMRGKCFLT